MHTIAIINALAALIVVAYAVNRIHVLQWSVAPLLMASYMLLAFGSVMSGCAPILNGLMPSLGEMLLHVGLAANSVANWERTRCDAAGNCPIRFSL